MTHALSARGGGIPAVMRPVYRHLTVNHSVDAELFGLADDSPLENDSNWGRAKPQTFEVRGPSALGYSPDLRKHLLEFHSDVIHTHGIFKHTSADVHSVARRGKIPYVVAPHGMLDSWALSRSRFKKLVASWWFESRHLANARCFHALCKAEAEDIRRCGYPEPICVIPNGIDLPKVERPSQTTDRPRTLLFLGRIHPKKGLVELLQAWHRCVQEDGLPMREARLIIAGWDDGGHEKSLRKWVIENSLENSVQFAGPVFGEIKTKWLNEAHGFVLPSYSEGLPMSVLEAWSYRLPVLMTEHCHLPEGFDHDAAISITTSPESIMAGLRRWLESESSELERIGQNGFDLVSQSFTWERIASQYLAMYRWMLGGQRPEFVDFG
ncbi:glycosyltransferase [Rhodopirellula sallentina]|uniref:Glycosyl transferase, group 1 family protein n=1 Tax=Rhodopirellula sallentina SM41 TaxID=1263870 RepID=M5U0W1_9BACT|nr:glycosyltransferase [Rhodopirellula sallentina]EMI54904.1 glycosyl transferase, group 1 family protein [Rhodopirellula sallentina SM41]